MRRPVPLILLAFASCSSSSSPPPTAAVVPATPATVTVAPAARRFGDAMSEVARRFDRAGRAVEAGRWDLADYDLGEIEEVFEQDIPHAERPPDVPVDPTPIAAAFAANALPALQKSVATRNPAAFARAYADASAACNGCHAAAAKKFIVIPSTPGIGVPDLSPLAPTPAAGSGR